MKALLDTIFDSQKQSTDDDWHLKDGIKFCKQCHTPRQVTKTFGPKLKTVTCNCRCQTEAYEKRESERRQKAERSHRAEHRKACIQDPAMANKRFENDQGHCPDAIKKAKNYVASFDTFAHKNIGLLLYGDVGTGKTFVAACIGNALHDAGHKVLATSLSRMRAGLPSEFDTSASRNTYIDNFGRYDLLIIDDFGVERETDYVMESIFNLIDARHKSGRPTIITTNLPLTSIKNPQDIKQKRIYDRILAMTVPLLFEGDSLRANIHSTKLSDAKKILSKNC